MSMGIFTSMMALVGSGVGSAISHAGDKAKRDQAALELELSGVCRSTSAEFESDLTARFKWNWDHGRSMFEPELIEFLEIDSAALDDYIKYWVREETVKAGFIPTGVAKLGGDYRQFFLDKYEQEMFYWIHCKDKGIEYERYRKCPVCGRYITHMDEKCPVCDAPPMLKLNQTYTQAKSERERLRERRLELIKEYGASGLWRKSSLWSTVLWYSLVGLIIGFVALSIINIWDVSFILIISGIAFIVGGIYGRHVYNTEKEKKESFENELAAINKKLGL